MKTLMLAAATALSLSAGVAYANEGGVGRQQPVHRAVGRGRPGSRAQCAVGRDGAEWPGAMRDG